MSTLNIAEVVGKRIYLQFCLLMPNDTYFAFKMFNNKTSRKQLEKILRGERVLLWSQKGFLNGFKRKTMSQFYYNHNKFFYFNCNRIVEVTLEQGHNDTIADFLISNLQFAFNDS